MVDPEIVATVRHALLPDSRRVLITGGTGFVGARLAWLLAEAGQQVTVVGRNRYRQGRQQHRQAIFADCDVTDAARLTEVCRDQDVVVHAAALSTPWGPAEPLHRINVQGTKNVVEACRENPGVRLIHVSSTAIHFEFRDKLAVVEDAPLPAKFCCAYAESKAEAEAVIRDAVRTGLNAVIVRARAVIGPGDNSLLPRIVAAARRGRWRQIGRGDNLVDLTYVDNLVYALALAIVRGAAGSVATITNEEPVLLWPLLNELCRELGLPLARRRVSRPVALAVARLSERWQGWRRPGEEPPLTAYGAGLLANSQTFSPVAARESLGYRPLVPLAEGIRRTVADRLKRDDGHAQTFAEVTLFSTGYTAQPHGLAERGRSWRSQPFHALCALIRHPREGLFLFDTGYAPRFRAATKKFPYSIYGRLTPIVTTESLAIVAQLAELGIAADEIRGVIISHFHADHVAGLRDFPKAEFIAAERAWRAVAWRRGASAVARAYLPQLLPDDFASRLRTIDQFHDPGIGPFERSHDLFGDGSVRLLDLSGHATGQIGALVQTGPSARTLLAADAAWTLGSMRAGTMPHRLTYVFIDSVAELRQSLARLRQFSRQYPDVEIVPTHCPEVAQRGEFDAVVRAHMQAGGVRSSTSQVSV